MVTEQAVETVPPARPANGRPRDPLATRYRAVRRQTEQLCAPLSAEDCTAQSMPDASPAKWHLAHTTWFFETFVLTPTLTGYRPYHERFSYLFNSYYNAVGERVARPRRGLLTRPSLAEVEEYREAIDRQMNALLDDDNRRLDAIREVVELGLHHEQQHQELILTDIKHLFGGNPLRPAYHEPLEEPRRKVEVRPLRWLEYAGDLCWVGHDGEGFAFDNESPRHREFVEGFRLADRLVTNGEFRAFVEDGGYHRPELWLSDGWNARQAQGWEAPLYWERCGDGWSAFTLSGLRPLDDVEPVSHVNFYEADAFARWAGARLPTEAEWERAASSCPVEGHFVESGRLHPRPLVSDPGDADQAPAQLFGDVWEWTRSPYSSYPGYQPARGALGEYNGKFMCNQMVLRGGSCATPRDHIRATYRNFFPPDARWQFTGIRLANDLS